MTNPNCGHERNLKNKQTIKERKKFKEKLKNE